MCQLIAIFWSIHSQVSSLCVPTHEGAETILGFFHKDSNPNPELNLSDLTASSRLLSASPVGEDFNDAETVA